ILARRHLQCRRAVRLRVRREGADAAPAVHLRQRELLHAVPERAHEDLLAQRVRREAEPALQRQPELRRVRAQPVRRHLLDHAADERLVRRRRDAVRRAAPLRRARALRLLLSCGDASRGRPRAGLSRLAGPPCPAPHAGAYRAPSSPSVRSPAWPPPASRPASSPPGGGSPAKAGRCRKAPTTPTPPARCACCWSTARWTPAA